MKKLIAILFHFLPNAAHFNYCTRVKSVLATASETVKTALGGLITDFENWCNQEFAQMEWVRKSILTEKIAEADVRMDRALVALKAQVHALEYSLTTTIAEAAHRLNIMLNSYGKVYRKPYDEQMGDMLAIIAQLIKSYAADVTTLGVGPLCAELVGAFTEFQKLFEERGADSLKKPENSFVTIRREIEKVYHKIAVKLDAGAAMGTDGFAAVIDQLNPDIEHMNNQFHRALRNIAAAEPAPIPPQTHTGQPLTPTTDVYYVTPHDGTVKLELGKDYNLTYKKNKDVGTAECTIHGKGGYTGHKTITFIIEEAK
jgi:hypothetical protein